MSTDCPLCDGACAGAELRPLLDARLHWFWEQIGRVADRRGDATLLQGSVAVRAPDAAEERAAATGLVGGRVLKPGQSRSIDLAQLTLKLRVRGAQLTPGVVAAHALGRRLARRAAADAQRQTQEQDLFAMFLTMATSAGREAFRHPERIWAVLRRSGAVTRLLGTEAPERYLRTAFAVIASLPAADARTDRRRVATDATGNPHALDHGSPLAILVIAILVAAGRIDSGNRPRDAWATVGVDYDDVVGGLIAVGILPMGWSVPDGATVTLPPRVLNSCEWPRPEVPDAWVFVTENPSVAAAASDLALNVPAVRLLCTSGTPAASEVAAIARLALTGWRIAVRADFDSAGLEHVATILRAVPGAAPWRMGVTDYVDSLQKAMQEEIRLERVPDVAWDPDLSNVMRAKGLAAYEEALLPLLLEDIAARCPVTTIRTGSAALS